MRISLCYNIAMNAQKHVKNRLLLFTLFLLLGCLACSPSQNSSGLFISEVVSSNRASLIEDTLGSPDWVELYNGTNAAINLNGYGFSDNIRNLHKFVFGDVTIPANGYVVLYLSNAEGVENPDAPIAGFGLSKGGENLFLTDPYFGLVQELTLPALESDVSYARRADGTYGFTMATTPAAPPEQIFDSAADIYNQPTGDLMISEILPRPDGGDAWVELYNASNESIRLENYCISDSAATPKRFPLPSGTLEAGGYLVCSLSGAKDEIAPDGSIHANFRIGEDENAIYLADSSGVLIDSLSWSEDLAVGLSVLSDEQYSAFPTPAAPNSTRTLKESFVQEAEEAGPVRINEVQQSNAYTLTDQDGDRSGWVELCNRSKQEVSLEGYFLSDKADAPYQFALPDRVLAPGEYVVIFLSAKNRVQDGEIHASFKLAQSETALYLSNDATCTRETFDLPPQAPEDISVGRAEDGSMVFYAFPTPWYENAAAFSDLNDAVKKVADVTINEVFSNAAFGDDTPDWIELKNNTEQAISLNGWYLSDSLTERKRWQMPDITLEPGGYAVVYTTSEAVDEKEAMASFSIAASGETICLSDPNGCRVDSLATGTIRAGGSAGRSPNTAEARVFFSAPTPGKANEGAYFTGYSPKPIFSDNTLLHSDAFSLSLRCMDANAEIRYTTDGSEPTERSARYEAPMVIERNTVVRAASFRDGLLSSDIATQTFLFDAERELPILCLTTDPGNLTGPDAIMAERNLYNDDWERAAVIEYQSGQESFSVNCGIRLHGNMTRLTNGYGKPSMKLCFRGCYQNPVLNYPLFKDGKTTVFHDLLLRNGSDMRFAVIRDELLTGIAYRLSDQLCVMTAQYVAAYFNGEYMGLYAIKEAIGTGYFAEHFGVTEDSVEMHRPEREEHEDFLALMRYAKENDLTDEEHYRYMESCIDFDSMIDWLIFEAYSANRDLALNVRYYRSMELDGKWHYALFDFDLSMNTDASFDALLKGAWNIIPRKLLQNKTFQDRFLTRFAYLLQHELSQEAVLAEFDSLIAQIDEEMVLERARWPKALNNTWEGYALELKNEILKDRAGQLKASIADYLNRPLAEIEAYFEK